MASDSPTYGVLLLLRTPGGNKGPMENPAKHLVYRPTTMQLLSILTTTVEIMPKVCDHTCSCCTPQHTSSRTKC